MNSAPAAITLDISSQSPTASAVTVLFTDVPHTLAALFLNRLISGRLQWKAAIRAAE